MKAIPIIIVIVTVIILSLFLYRRKRSLRCSCAVSSQRTDRLPASLAAAGGSYGDATRTESTAPILQGGEVPSSSMIAEPSSHLNYVVEREDGSKLLISLQGEAFVDWKHLKTPTLALIEWPAYWFLNEIYRLDVPDLWLGNIAWTYMKELFEANKDSWVSAQSMKETGNYILGKNAIAKAKEPIPENLDIVFCDHRKELYYNPLAAPYLEIQTFGEPNTICDSHYVSLNILKDWFYNEAKEDSYYHQLIKKWSWADSAECERKLNMLMEMNCFDIFNEFTFGIYEDLITPNVKAFFSSFKYKDYSFDSTAIFNDLVLLNELELEIVSHSDLADNRQLLTRCDAERGARTHGDLADNRQRTHSDLADKRKLASNVVSDGFASPVVSDQFTEQKARDARSRKHSMVVVYGRAAHLPRYVEFLTRYHRPSDYPYEYEKKIEEAVKYSKRNHRDLTGKYGKFVKELMDTFRYDKESEENGFKDWKLRSIEEMDKEKICICHDSAYYVSTKLKERFPNVKTWRLSMTRIDRNRTHGLTIMQENENAFYVVDACHTHSSGVFGPFQTFEKALNDFLLRNYPSHAYFSQMLVDHTKPGDPYDCFKTTIDLSGHFESVDHAALLRSSQASSLPAVSSRSVDHAALPAALAIYIHGMNPSGEKYAEELTRTMRKRFEKDGVSFGCYYRSRHCASASTCNEFVDTYDLDVEWIRFKTRLFDTFKEELKADCKIYLFGHSYGACFAKFFRYKLTQMKSPVPLKVIAVSLDGSDLHTTVPFFIGDEAKDEEIEYKEEGPIWRGKNYININGIYKPWYDNMMRCDKLPAENYLIIDYKANEKNPNKATLEYRGNPIYERYWELAFGKEYSHSLHAEKPCWELIWKLVYNYK